MKTNLDSSRLDQMVSTAKEIREWIGKHSHPEKYSAVKNQELVRDFVHTLDLLETVLVRIEINIHLSRLALEQLENPSRVGSLGWEFWQIDIEEFFASNLLELCYQLSNAWEQLDEFANEDKAFEILQIKHKKLSNTFLARHKATHFQPEQFQEHNIATQYSILRRPYYFQAGKLEKELAKYTMPKVVKLVQDAVQEGLNYLSKFREATIG
jgi:hypothetical protein